MERCHGNTRLTQTNHSHRGAAVGEGWGLLSTAELALRVSHSTGLLSATSISFSLASEHTPPCSAVCAGCAPVAWCRGGAGRPSIMSGAASPLLSHLTLSYGLGNATSQGRVSDTITILSYLCACASLAAPSVSLPPSLTLSGPRRSSHGSGSSLPHAPPRQQNIDFLPSPLM